MLWSRFGGRCVHFACTFFLTLLVAFVLRLLIYYIIFEFVVRARACSAFLYHGFMRFPWGTCLPFGRRVSFWTHSFDLNALFFLTSRMLTSHDTRRCYDRNCCCRTSARSLVYKDLVLRSGLTLTVFVYACTCSKHGLSDLLISRSTASNAGCTRTAAWGCQEVLV